jgi:hypothetical protein
MTQRTSVRGACQLVCRFALSKFDNLGLGECILILCNHLCLISLLERCVCIQMDVRCLHFRQLSECCICLKLRLRVCLYSPFRNVIFVSRCSLHVCTCILSSECYVCAKWRLRAYVCLHEVFRTDMSDKVSASLYRVHQGKVIHMCVSMV